MVRKANRVLSGLLAVCLVLGLFPVGAHAEELPESKTSYSDSVTLDGQDIPVTGDATTTVTEHENGTTTDTTWTAEGTSGNLSVEVTGTSTETADQDGTPIAAQGREDITGKETEVTKETVTEVTPAEQVSKETENIYNEPTVDSVKGDPVDGPKTKEDIDLDINKAELNATAISGKGTATDKEKNTLTDAAVQNITTGFTQNGNTYEKVEENGNKTITTTITPIKEGEKWTGYTQVEITKEVTKAGTPTVTDNGTATTEITSTDTPETIQEKPQTVVTYDLPERPQAGTSTTADGATVEVTVSELTTEDGTVVGYYTETKTTNPDGTSSVKNETLYGYKRTTVTTTVSGTKTTTTTVEKVTTPKEEVKIDEVTTETKNTTVTAGERELSVAVVTGSATQKLDKDGNVIYTHGDMTKDHPLQPDITNKKPANQGDIYAVTHMVNGFLPAYQTADGTYSFYFDGTRGLESALYLRYLEPGQQDTDKPHRIIATQFQLTDANGNKFYTYCTDFSQSPEEGSKYSMQNVADADFLKAHADQIRAIATHGYWGVEDGADVDKPNQGSLAAFRKMLVDAGKLTSDEASKLTDGMSLLATQAAIWHYANRDAAKEPNIKESHLTHLKAESAYSEEDGAWNTRGDIYETDEINQILQKVYHYLTTDLTQQPPKSTKLETSNVTLTAEVKVPENSDNAEVTLTVDTDVTNAPGEYIITVTDKNGKELVKTEKKTSLVDIVLEKLGLDLNKAENKELTVTVDGEQKMGQDAYLFTALDENGDPNPTVSQSFLGVMEAARKVFLQFKVFLGLTDPTPTATTTTRTVVSEDTTTTTWDEVETTTYQSTRTEKEITTETVTETQQHRVWNLSYNNHKDEEEDEDETTEVKKVEKHNDRDDENAKTGDDMRLWFLVNELSALALAVLLMAKRLRKKESL